MDETGTGTDVLEKLRRHKVNTDYMIRRPEGMGIWLAVFDNSGDVVASISKRPDLSEIENILDEQGDEIFAEADSIAVEFDIEVPILKKALALAENTARRSIHRSPICPSPWNDGIFCAGSAVSSVMCRKPGSCFQIPMSR